MLVTIYAIYVRNTADAFTFYSDRLKAQALVQAGIELAAYHIIADPESHVIRSMSRFQIGAATIAVAARSENARIDLNTASQELLAGLFVSLGTRQDQAENFAERIVAWRSPPKATGTDEEAALYRTVGKLYGPRRAPFQHVNEVSLVLGAPPAIIDRALPYLTVYSGQPEINLLGAAPEVLAALPGLTPDRLQQLLTLRQHAPQDVLKERLGLLARYATLQSSKAFHMTVEVALGERRTRSEVVIVLLTGDSEPYRIVSWREDVDSAGGLIKEVVK